MILLGSARVHTIRSDGTEVILAVLGSGEGVGEMSLADSLTRSADVTTLEESVLLLMDHFAFRTALEEEPMLICNLAEVLSLRLRLTNAHLLSLAALDVPGRVAFQLLALAREYGERSPGGTRIPMRLTQTDLASLVGASRVRVGQAIALFKKRGCFSVGEDHRIVIHDPETLTRRAHECLLPCINRPIRFSLLGVEAGSGSTSQDRSSRSSNLRATRQENAARADS